MTLQWAVFLNADGYVNANGDLLGFNMYLYCGNNPVMVYDPTGYAWYHWAIGAAIVAACAIAVVATAGGAAAGLAAVAAVANGMAAATTASTIAAGAFIGSATMLGGCAITAALTSSSSEEFCEQGNWGTVAVTALGGIIGGADGYQSAKNSVTNDKISCGYSRPIKNGATPNSRYIQYDQASNCVRSDTVYDANGNWQTRIDYMHSHNIGGVDYCPHMHIAPRIDNRGFPIGRETVIRWD